MKKPKELLEKLEAEFVKSANKERAKQQQWYMKSQMPYFGVVMPEVKKITKKVLKEYAPENNQEYRDMLLYIFENAKYRELWYAGLVYADRFKAYITEKNIDVYEKIVRITNWWDIVDHVAQNLIGKALLGSKQVRKYAKKWILDDDLWIRRTALILQLKYKDKTDFQLFKELILQVTHEKDFFIRKAIGWALRSYSYTEPEKVICFIEQNKDKLSTLSVREGLKVLTRNGFF